LKTLDPATEGGAKALRRLETELMGWLTTVNPGGQPQSSPIWFLWRDGEVVIYSHRRAPRNDNVVANARVVQPQHRPRWGRRRDDGGRGAGRPVTAAVLGGPRVQAKHRHDRPLRLDAQWLAENYPVPIVITPTRWRLG
jgi:hypothetical protein